MKFTCSKDKFNDGINIALKAIPGKTSMPILECVVIEAKDGFIKLTTNDMQIGIETKVEADVSEQGVVLVNAKMISEIVRRLPDNDVNFEVDDRDNILIFCGKSRFNLPGNDGEEFPKIPNVDIEKKISISQFSFKEMITQTIFSISTNESNKVLTGELFEVNGDELRIASLDMIRVSIRKIKLKESYDRIKVIIPGKTLNEISKILSGNIDDMVDISFAKNYVLFEFGNTRLVSRLIEGNFFNIDQMLKNNYETMVTVKKRDLYGCVDRATLLLREIDKNPMVVSITDDEMNLEMKTSMAVMDEDVPIEKEGEDLRIGLNPKYIIDILKVVDDEDIKLYFHNANSPCFIKNEDEGYIYLILPINI